MRSTISQFLAVTVLCVAAFATTRGFSQSEKADKPPKQYLSDKRLGQKQLRLIDSGQWEEAIAFCRECLKYEPDYPESHFHLAVALGLQGKMKEARRAVREAVASDVPPGRFLAGPRNLTEPLARDETIRAFLLEEGGPLLHGPMLGSMTDGSCRIWVRTSEPMEVTIEASPKAAEGEKIECSLNTSAEEDFTGIGTLRGLAPDTVYRYDILQEGRSLLDDRKPSFRTFPSTGDPAAFTVAFGGGAGYVPHHERMWNTLLAHDLRAFLFLGDNVYIDAPDSPAMQLYTYYRRQSRPEYRRFVATTPVFAIWDDHDFCTNDQRGGPLRDEPKWKIPVWNVFQQNWLNPSYGGGIEAPGCWFHFRIADVDFIMLDGRYWRENPKKDSPSMLGPIQKQWLLETLEEAEGTFKVLASPVPWVLEAKGTSLDTWRGYEKEREEIFSFIEEHEIEGVVLISADRHRSDHWTIQRPNGYTFHEFESSKLTNEHTHGTIPKAEFGYNEKCSFGQLHFDTTLEDPTVTYEIFSIDDEPIYQFTLRRSRLAKEK